MEFNTIEEKAVAIENAKEVIAEKEVSLQEAKDALAEIEAVEMKEEETV